LVGPPLINSVSVYLAIIFHPFLSHFLLYLQKFIDYEKRGVGRQKVSYILIIKSFFVLDKNTIYILKVFLSKNFDHIYSCVFEYFLWALKFKKRPHKLAEQNEKSHQSIEFFKSRCWKENVQFSIPKASGHVWIFKKGLIVFLCLTCCLSLFRNCFSFVSVKEKCIFMCKTNSRQWILNELSLSN